MTQEYTVGVVTTFNGDFEITEFCVLLYIAIEMSACVHGKVYLAIILSFSSKCVYVCIYRQEQRVKFS